MTHTSDFFCAQRFLQYLRTLLTSNSKRLLLLMLLIFLGLCIWYFTYGFDASTLSFYAKEPYRVSRFPTDFMMSICLKASFLALLTSLAFGIVITLPDRRDKGAVQRFLLLPASRFEKYMGGLALMCILLLLTCAIIVLADYARIAYISAVYPPLKDCVHSIITDVDWSMIVDPKESTSVLLMIFLFCISLLRLGRVFFKRLALLKSSALILAGTFLAGWLTFESLYYDSRYVYPRSEEIYADAGIANLHLNIFLLACTLFHEWLVYKRLGDIESK